MKAVAKLFYMTSGALLLCTGALLINASKVHGEIPYISVTVTLFIEICKFILVVLGLFLLKPPKPIDFSWKESCYYAIPSFLYTVDNNLAYLILQYMDPATLSVLWNLKILTTAILFRIIMKHKLSEIQYISIILLLLGVITSQSDHVKKMGPLSPPKETNIISDRSYEELIFGIILVLIGVTISSIAGVFTEWAFKRTCTSGYTDHFLWQNLQFCFYGILFNFIGIFLEWENIEKHGYFHGYSYWTLGIIFIHAISGITMGFMFKFLDNIACVYSHALAMIFTMCFSIAFFHFSPSLEFACGMGVVVISLYLYHYKGEKKEMENSKTHEKDSEDEMDRLETDLESTSELETESMKPSPSNMKYKSKKNGKYEQIRLTSDHLDDEVEVI